MESHHVQTHQKKLCRSTRRLLNSTPELGAQLLQNCNLSLRTHTGNTNTALERGRVAAKQLRSYTKHPFTSFLACGILNLLRLCSNSQDLPLKANFREKKRLFDWLQSSSKLDDTVHIKQQNSFHSNTHSLFAQLFLGHLSVTLLPANSCREGRLLAAL